jgi:hypothetical protein
MSADEREYSFFLASVDFVSIHPEQDPWVRGETSPEFVPE